MWHYLSNKRGSRNFFVKLNFTSFFPVHKIYLSRGDKKISWNRGIIQFHGIFFSIAIFFPHFRVLCVHHHTGVYNTSYSIGQWLTNYSLQSIITHSWVMRFHEKKKLFYGRPKYLPSPSPIEHASITYSKWI